MSSSWLTLTVLSSCRWQWRIQEFKKGGSFKKSARVERAENFRVTTPTLLNHAHFNYNSPSKLYYELITSLRARTLN